jgi:hypothetical protein
MTHDASGRAVSTPGRRTRTRRRARAPHLSTRLRPTFSRTPTTRRTCSPWRARVTSTPGSTTLRCGCWRTGSRRWRTVSTRSRPEAAWPRWTPLLRCWPRPATTSSRRRPSTAGRTPTSHTTPAGAVSRRASSTRSTTPPTTTPSTSRPRTSTARLSATPRSSPPTSTNWRRCATTTTCRCSSTTRSGRPHSATRSSTVPISSGSRRRSGFTGRGRPSAASSSTAARSLGATIPNGFPRSAARTLPSTAPTLASTSATVRSPPPPATARSARSVTASRRSTRGRRCRARRRSRSGWTVTARTRWLSRNTSGTIPRWRG